MFVGKGIRKNYRNWECPIKYEIDDGGNYQKV